jgi:cephalosporin hydroxylase
VGAVTRHNAAIASQSARWLVKRREHTNYTYDLTPLNLKHLAWWAASVAAAPVEECRSWITEVLMDRDLQAHAYRISVSTGRRGLTDEKVLVGRRAGWYAVIRALKPDQVVETGTDKGLGSLVIAAALLRNGKGHLTTMDINPDSGFLISGRYADVAHVERGDSLSLISKLTAPIDLFIHDSDHSAAHEAAEFRTVAPHLASSALVLSDNSHITGELPAWAEATGRVFMFFREEPEDHWYPCAGIGAAWYPRV